MIRLIRLITWRIAACTVALSAFAELAGAAPALPAINTNNVINVTAAPYNAIGDGVITNTVAIQAAINAAAAGPSVNGLSGGTVEIPAGVFLCGPLTLKSSVNLQIDGGATLKALPSDQYPGGIINPAHFISGSSLHDVEISGSGTIEGQGGPWWDIIETNSSASRPNLINLSTCSKVLVQDVTLHNSPSQNLVIKGRAGNVTIQRVTILAPSSSDRFTPSHNTDAIDLAETNAVIRDCYISVGDDNVAVGSDGSTSSDILITNCMFGEGHGVSIGSHTGGGVSDMTVINCGFSGTDNGIRLKSEQGRGGLIHNLNYLNLGMTNVDWPLLIYSYYQYGLGTITTVTPAIVATNTAGPVTSKTPIWRDITFSNIVATSSSSRPPLMIWGLHEMVVSNVLFSHVSITSSATRNPGIYNARDIRFEDSRLALPSGTSTLLLYNAGVTFTRTVGSGAYIPLDGLSTNGIGNSLGLYDSRVSLKNTNVIANAPITLDSSTLAVTNNLNLNELSGLNFALGTNQSQIIVASNLVMGGAINITDGGGFGTGSYTLLTYKKNLSGSTPALGAKPAGYMYSFDTGTVGQVKLVVSTPPPDAPEDVNVSVSNKVVMLEWSPSAGATGYSVKRSTVSGGTNLTVFSGITTTNFTDTSVTNGGTYFYIVTAVNSGGESLPSVEVSATPQPSLSPPELTPQNEGASLQLDWPADHTGWRLEIQTNTAMAGIGTNWVTWLGSDGTNRATIPIGPGNGSVFLRLAYP